MIAGLLLLPLLCAVTADTSPRNFDGTVNARAVSALPQNLLDFEARGLPDFIPREDSAFDDLEAQWGLTSRSAFAFTKRQSCGNWGMCNDGSCAPYGAKCCGNRKYKTSPSTSYRE